MLDLTRRQTATNGGDVPVDGVVGEKALLVVADRVDDDSKAEIDFGCDMECDVNGDVAQAAMAAVRRLPYPAVPPACKRFAPSCSAATNTTARRAAGVHLDAAYVDPQQGPA